MTRSKPVWCGLALLLQPVSGALAQSAPASQAQDSAAAGSRSVTISLELDAQGAVKTCVVTGSSGLKELDDMTCRMVREQGKYEPILDEDNKPVPATIVQTFTFHAEQDGKQLADMDIDEGSRQ